MRLWTGKSTPWTHNEYYKSNRSFIEAWTDMKVFKGAGISYNYECERPDGTYRTSFYHWTLGFQFRLSFGHETVEYDGIWHRFSIGPLFVTWYE